MKILFALWLCGMASEISGAADFDSLCADRTAVERVYYNHRLGTKPPFEQVMPRDLAERLVRQDLHKEAVLKKVYGVEITDALLAAEVRRIDSTTRAPDMLAELKTALGNDTNRFARTVAKPIVVERLLRDKFDNDDSLHAPQRRELETIRGRLIQSATEVAVSNLVATLRTNAAGQFSETTWQLSPRPPDQSGAETPDEMEIRKRFGPNAQLLSSPGRGGDRKFYFQDLPGDLQNVLQVQLRRPGAVSAVIEMPGGFGLYLCEERTPEILRAAALSVTKRSYEQWLSEQDEGPAAPRKP
jgi:hypothetical protein